MWGEKVKGIITNNKNEYYKGEFKEGRKHVIGIHVFNNAVIIKCKYWKD
jgi:hypothetical protein